MKIVLLSDTHTYHNDVKLPKGDVLIHAGDVSSRGYTSEVEDFLEWFESLEYKHKLFISGNHDFFFERNSEEEVRELVSKYSTITYLFDEDITIDGVKFYGTPWQPWFCDWAFNIQRGKLFEKWNKIPEDTDVLITHGPPYGILDKVKPSWREPKGENVGCEELLCRIGELKKLKLNVFGHIHEGYGKEVINGVTYINASVLNERYVMANKPKVFTIDN